MYHPLLTFGSLDTNLNMTGNNVAMNPETTNDDVYQDIAPTGINANVAGTSTSGAVVDDGKVVTGVNAQMTPTSTDEDAEIALNMEGDNAEVVTQSTESLFVEGSLVTGDNSEVSASSSEGEAYQELEVEGDSAEITPTSTEGEWDESILLTGTNCVVHGTVSSGDAQHEHVLDGADAQSTNESTNAPLFVFLEGRNSEVNSYGGNGAIPFLEENYPIDKRFYASYDTNKYSYQSINGAQFASKDIDEKVYLTFDFVKVTDRPLNPTLTIELDSGATHSDMPFMFIGDPVIIGTKVLQRIEGGLEGNEYKIRCVIESPIDNVYVVGALLPVVKF